MWQQIEDEINLQPGEESKSSANESPFADAIAAALTYLYSDECAGVYTKQESPEHQKVSWA